MARRPSREAITAPPGRSWCEAWSRSVDATLQEGLASLRRGDPPHGMAVVALGSYARRTVCPASDIDVLVLHDGWSQPDLEAVVQAVCYPLWDAGLVVGHAVRTPREAVASAANRLDTATTLADRRLVAGDPGLFDAFALDARRWLHRRLAPLVDELAAGKTRPGDDKTPGTREPHLKDGPGGLRDLQALRWAAACLLGETGLDPLVSAGYLGAAERRTLAAAEDTLLAARCALHLARPAARRRPSKETDVLRVEAIDDVADLLDLDALELGRQLSLASRAVVHLSRRVWPEMIRDARRGSGRTRGRQGPHQQVGEGIVLAGGLVEADDGFDLARRPSWGWELLAAAAERGTHLGRSTAARLGRAVDDGEQPPWDDSSRSAFLAVLRSGRAGLPALSDADQVGLLTAGVPEWAQVRGRPQWDPVHSYDLDTHCFETVACVVEVAAGACDPWHARLWEELACRDELLLAALLHDIGKPWPGDHSLVGGELAETIVARMGFGRGRAELVGRLVRHHLLLPSIAVARDLDDPDEVAAAAHAATDLQTLDALYLLAIADGRATGPYVHSAWRHELLARLHDRAREQFRAVTGPTAG